MCVCVQMPSPLLDMLAARPGNAVEASTKVNAFPRSRGKHGMEENAFPQAIGVIITVYERVHDVLSAEA